MAIRSNVPTDQEILAAVNKKACRRVNAAANKLGEPRLPLDFRCDMSRVGSIRDAWEWAVNAYKKETGLDPLEALARIEADLRSPANAPELHIERR